MAIDVSRIQGGGVAQPTATVQSPTNSMAGVGTALQGVADILGQVERRQAEKQRGKAIVGAMDAMIAEADALSGNPTEADDESAAAATKAATEKARLEKAVAQGKLSPQALARRQMQLQRDVVAQFPGYEDVVMSVFNQQQGRMSEVYNAATIDYRRQQQLEQQLDNDILQAFAAAGKSNMLVDTDFDTRVELYETHVAEPSRRAEKRAREAAEFEGTQQERTAFARKNAREMLADEAGLGIVAMDTILRDTGISVGQKIEKLFGLRREAASELRKQVAVNDPAVAKEYEAHVLGPFNRAIEALSSNKPLNAVLNQSKMELALLRDALNEENGNVMDRFEVLGEVFGPLMANDQIANSLASSLKPVIKLMADGGSDDLPMPFDAGTSSQNLADPTAGLPKVEGNGESRKNRDAIRATAKGWANALRGLYDQQKNQDAQMLFESVMTVVGSAANRTVLKNNPSAFDELTRVIADPKFMQYAGSVTRLPLEDRQAIVDVMEAYSNQLRGRMARDAGIQLQKDYVLEWDEQSNVATGVLTTQGRGQSLQRRQLNNFASAYTDHVIATAHLAGHQDYQRVHQLFQESLRQGGEQ